MYLNKELFVKNAYIHGRNTPKIEKNTTFFSLLIIAKKTYIQMIEFFKFSLNTRMPKIILIEII